MKNDPKIVLFDLETLPDPNEAVKVWPQISAFPGRTLRATITSCICAGWKVFGEKKAHVVSAWDFPKAWKKDVNNDYHVVKAIYDELCDADCIVTHNGKRFDERYLQTRLLKHGLPPLPRILHVDTKQVAQRNLFSFSNKLDYLGEQFIGERKLDHEGWELWVKVFRRDEKSQNKMARYCKQDVNLLEKNFRKLRPFMRNIPNHNLFTEGTRGVCHNCGSSRIKSAGMKYTNTNSYQRLRCKDCGTYVRVDKLGRMPRTI